MSQLTAQNGQFWLDDQPILIQAGEFHYYRTPQDQWAHRLGLLKDAGFNTVATYIPWLWHQPEEDLIDFDGHSHPMRNLAGFLDMAAEMGFYLIPRPGPYIMAETINEGIPPWFFEKHPQAAFISQDSKIHNIVSYLHSDFLSEVSRWYEAIFQVLAPRQITRGGKIIMVQLDNEIGMVHWVRNILDTNPDTHVRFAAYLQEAYGDELFKRYPTDADLVTFLREGLLHPTPAFGERIVEDYRRFFRLYFRQYAAFLKDEGVKNGLEVLPVINIHGFMNGGKTFPIGLSQLVDVMQLEGMISATDVYPLVIGEGTFHQLLLLNEMTKTLQNPEQALFSIEFQSGGNLDFTNAQASMQDLHARLSISVGMRAINHYSFAGGENHPVLSPVKRHDWGPPIRTDGTLRRHYYRYPRLSRVLNAYGEDLVRSRPQTVTTVGFLLDYFMTEVNNENTRDATRVITHQREKILFDMIGRGLALTHRPFNAVEISRAALDPAQIPLLWVMLDRHCSAADQQKLVDYVHQGGRLVIAGRIPVQEFNHEPCTILKEALGIREVQGGLPFIDALIQVFDQPDIPVSFVETYTGEWDEVFATRDNGGVVGFIHTLGQGQVMLFGAAFDIVTLADLDIVQQMAQRMGCPSLFTVSDWVDVRISLGERGSFLFVSNYQEDPIDTTIDYQGQALFGGSTIHVAARNGLILPLDWQLHEGILIHYATAEISEITTQDSQLVLKTLQPEFTAELTLSGWSCEGGQPLADQRVKVQGKDGTIILRKD
jgi:beta-galactosidase